MSRLRADLADLADLAGLIDRAGLALVLLVSAAALGACSKTGSPPSGFGVNVTVDAKMVPSAQRAMITTDKMTVVSDKAGSTPVVRTLADLPKAIAGGTIRFHYTPGGGVSAGDNLTFELDVSNGTTLIASGLGGPVTLEAGAVALTITLASTNSDGGTGKGNGVACVTSDECGSGFCADGVCCNEKCDDVCVSCKLATTKGTCTPFAAGMDPEAECAAKVAPPADTDAGSATTADGSSASAGADAGSSASAPADAGDSDAYVINTPDGGLRTTPNSCAGTCSGGRSCKFPDKTTCGTAYCNTRRDVVSFVCDGNGGCAPAVSMCSDYACNEMTGACRTSCSGPLECQLGKYCNVGSQCVDKKVDGVACGTDDECRGNHCAIPTGAPTGFCCNTKCDAPFTCNQSGSVGQCQCPNVKCGAGVACQVFYQDADGDGYGNATGAIPATAMAGCAGSPPTGYVADNTDCDDGDANVHPGQTAFFGDPSKGKGIFDYNCDGIKEKETPEYVGARCLFCGPVGTCNATTTTCGTANATASYACPQEYYLIRSISEPLSSTFSPPRPGLAAPADVQDPMLAPRASIAPGPGPILPIPRYQCCGCLANDKTGFLTAVNCGVTGTTYTCGACAAAGDAPSASTPASKQQRCR
jgi:hypothetical protein